ncbi:MAG: YceI family protein [Actinomycetota bacterium]
MTTETQTPPGAGSRSRRILLLAVVAALVLVIGVVVWWLSRDDAPEAASLEAATAEITDDADDGEAGTDAADDDGADAATDDADAGADSGSDDATAGSAGGIDGTWTVDTSVGEFSFQDSTGTFVGFRVGEELQAVGEIEAVGRTPGVSGTIDIDGTTVTAVSIEADMAALTTDDSRRDNRVQGALETDQFPTATFVLTSPIEFGEGAANGDPVSASASGDLTVHGVTQPVTFDLEAQLVDDTVVVVGSTEITFADYGVTVPSAPIVLSANDFGTIELQLFLVRS